MATARTWWGPTTLAAGGTASWRIGPMMLWLQRGEQELRVATRAAGGALDDTLAVAEAADAEPPADHVLQRFALPDPKATLELRPRLADRAIVARPETPFTLPPGARCTFFTSTPLWLELFAGEHLIEFPLHRPTDTWFGPSAMEGELCYSSRVNLHLARERLQQHPHRAISAVAIGNDGDDPLPLHRLLMPLPQLSLYCAADGSWHTEEVSITWDGAAGADSASVRIARTAPPWATGATRAAVPRDTTSSHPVLRVFNSLFA